MKQENILDLKSTFKALREDDTSAFESLYHAYESKLYVFALHLVKHKEDAEEIVQEVFLKVWERREHLDADLNFDGYLFSIAKSIAYNKARRRVYECAFMQYITINEATTGHGTEEAVAYLELVNLLQDIYTSLPPVRRQVFVMSRVEGKSNSEIAQLLNTSSSNIENHLNKALKAIKAKLNGYELA